MKCRAHLCATATSYFGLGLNLPLLGLNWGLKGPSEAPEAPQRPLLGPNLGLRGPSWVSIWASEGRVSIWALDWD